MDFIKFESVRDKEKARQELREAREQMLEKARLNAEQRAKRDAQKLLSGESTWMLPAVVSKLEKRSKEDSIKHKKSKKNKKTKKSKKDSKKKRKRKYSSSSSSDEDSESDSEGSKEKHRKRSKKSKKNKKKSKRRDSSSSESSSASTDNEELSQKSQADEWIEKPSTQPIPRRDNWMMDSTAFSLKTFSKNRNEPKNNESKQLDAYDPAKSTRELNPYWKTTGTGLPGFQRPKVDSDDEKHEMHHPIQQTKTSTGNWRKKPTGQENLKSKPSKSPSETSESSEESEKSEPEELAEKSGFSANDFLTDQQMNELGAKILKAEILGNSEVAAELKAKLEKARLQRAEIKEHKQHEIKTKTNTPNKKGEKYVLLTQTDEFGNCRPLKGESKKPFDSRDLYGSKSGRKKSKKSAETHVNGERVRYFPDDDKYDIKQMFESEKYATAAQSNLQFADIASKHKNPNDDLEDIFADKIRKTTDTEKSDKKEMQNAIREHERLSTKLDNCDKCFDSQKMNKSLIVAMGEKIYLTLPWHVGLQTGHCVIVPTQHASCSTQLDEDTWEELKNFCKAITRMFAAQRKDVVFFEIANKLQRHPHMAVHCVPVPMEQGESAPFYFKKAIEESEQEWSVNKQLVTLRREKGLRNCIPKGLPYFWVQFGMDSGFAHVIEDQDRFPSNFALEIIGGMLQLDSSKWRKPQKEQNFIAKVKIFADWWKKYDCTQ